MPPSRRILKSIRTLISLGAGVICVVALLWPRGTVPTFRHSPATLAFHSTAHHDQRRCFDNEDAQWDAALGSPIIATPPVASFEVSYKVDPLVEFVTDGWHYNRPPPIG
jgi:hypothetical protein